MVGIAATCKGLFSFLVTLETMLKNFDSVFVSVCHFIFRGFYFRSIYTIHQYDLFSRDI